MPFTVRVRVYPVVDLARTIPDNLNLLGAMATILQAEATAAAAAADHELQQAALLAAAEKFARLSTLDDVREGYWAGQRALAERAASAL
eukprot:COSAG01_NODE_9848_length_2321_cov_117.316382_3_plen_89_part_00